MVNQAKNATKPQKPEESKKLSKLGVFYEEWEIYGIIVDMKAVLK